MELTNEFRVDVPIAEAWKVLTDVERIAPCMPGAELQEIAGDEYRGIVKVKVGPITAQYKGAARFLEKDDSGHKAVLKAEGRDTRGQGNANATITATLIADGEGTAVTVVTDLTVTGKVAQFGRGVLADVSSKLLGQFVTCLHDDLLGASSVSANKPTPAPVEEKAQAVGNGPASSAPAATTTRTAPSNGQTAGTTSARTTSSSPSAPKATPATGAPKAAAAPAATTSPSDEVRKIDSRPAEPVDLLDAAGVPLAKRAIPIVAGVLVILWFLRRRARRRAR